MQNLHAVLLAGGSGTRFWPLSREQYPKQLLKLIGDETMIQRTVHCASRMMPMSRIYVVTHEQHAEAIQLQLGPLEHAFGSRIFKEPAAKNTALAIGLAAVYLQRKDPEIMMLVMPADHVIQNEDAFAKAIRAAAQVAEEGYLVTLGVKPTTPETGYGYIRRGAALRDRTIKGAGAYAVSSFIEKPDLSKAGRYFKDPRYYWNSGIFIWRAKDFLKAVRRHLPDLSKGLEEIQQSIGTDVEQKTIRQVYAKLQPVSVDYGILEHARKIALIPVSMGWTDVGSWTAIERVSPTDPRGNVKVGNVIDLDSRNSILYADKRLVATIGLEDLIVADTADATLVCSKNRAQDVRRVVEALRLRNAEEHLVHRTVFRPWGSYTVLENGDRYKIKRIVVNPRSRLSLQLHHKRSEHWVVVAGTARVTRGNEVFEIRENESTYIPMNAKHRLENPGDVPLQIIEVQNGDYLGEDDIVRFQDDYGRKA